MMDTLFSKIIARQIPADIVYEDELCLAFRDINPQAPVHILIIPKNPIPKVIDATEADKDLLGHLLIVAGKIAKNEGHEEAFRLVKAFRDINPQAPVHILIIPKNPIPKVIDATEADKDLRDRVFR